MNILSYASYEFEDIIVYGNNIVVYRSTVNFVERELDRDTGRDVKQFFILHALSWIVTAENENVHQ